MHIKMLLRQLLGLEYTRAVNCEFNDEGLVIDVALAWRSPRCSGCGQSCRGHET